MPSVLSTVRKVPRERWALAALIPLFLAALLAPPSAAGGWRWWHWPWLAALGAASLSLHLQRKAPRPPQRAVRAAALFTILLAVNAVIAASGGVFSPLWPLYFVLVALAGAQFGRLWHQGVLLGLIVTLEAAQNLQSLPPRESHGLVRLGLYLLALAAFSFVMRRLFLQRQVALQEQVDVHQRFREEAESFRKLEALRPGPHLEADSPENKMMRRMSAADKLNRDLDRLLDLTRKALGARTVVLLERDGNRLAVHRSAAGEASVHGRWTCRIGEGLIGGTAKLGQSVVISKLQRNPQGSSYFVEGEKPMSLMIVPVKEQDVLRAVVVADHPQADRFGKSELEIFEGFSQEVNLLLENARESSMRDRRGMTMETLSRLSATLSATLKVEDMIESLVDQIQVIIPYEQCAVFLVDRDRRRIVLKSQRGFRFDRDREISFPLKKGLVGFIITHGQPILFSDHRKLEVVPGYTGIGRMRAFMALPLSFHEELEGAMVFGSSKPGSFTSYQLDTLVTLSNQVAAQITNAVLHRQVEKLAVTDGLTGLYNHRHFQERLDYEMARAERSGQPLSLLLLDIDHFKKLNDTYGHPFGDEVLKGVSRQLAGVARSIDFVARYGGEEFAVILAGTDRKGCRRMAERVLKVVRTTVFSHGGTDLSVTVSVGSATSPEDGGTKEEIVRHSDKALYLAKKEGRDRHRSFKDVSGG